MSAELHSAVGALEMIRSASDFKRIQSGSRSRADATLLVRYRRNDMAQTRFGISTGRRLGSAVIRNRIRRRLRTVLRRMEENVAPGWDILLVARPPAVTARQSDLEQALLRLMGAAGLLADASQTEGKS